MRSTICFCAAVFSARFILKFIPEELELITFLINVPATWSSRTFSEQMDLTDIKTEKINWIVDDEQNPGSFRYFIIEC